MIYLQLFLSFLKVGTFSVGGGYAAIPFIQSEVVVGHGWLSAAEFADLVTISEMTPGPVTVNSATFVGMRIAGLGGAAAATLGVILPSLIIVSLLARLYYKYRSLSALRNVLACLRAAVVALIASAGLTILGGVVFESGVYSLGSADICAAALFCAAFFLLRRTKASPILVMALCGAANVVIFALK